jgi:hypothetical protein
LKADCLRKLDESTTFCKSVQKQVSEGFYTIIKDYKSYLNLRQVIASFEIDKYMKAKEQLEENYKLHKNAIKVLDESISAYNTSIDKSMFAL